MATIKVSTLSHFRGERQAANALGDCAVRAFATFFDIDYDTAREWLNKYNGGRDCVRGTKANAIGFAAENYGKLRGIEIEVKRGSGSVANFARTVDKALVIAASHATCVMNGAIYGNDDSDRIVGTDANQKVKYYLTMKVTNINLYLKGNV